MLEHGYSVTDIRVCLAGGADRDRTDDLMLAKHALSQLSYGPGTVTWWAWEDLNLRPHAYQARALTN